MKDGRGVTIFLRKWSIIKLGMILSLDIEGNHLGEDEEIWWEHLGRLVLDLKLDGIGCSWYLDLDFI